MAQPHFLLLHFRPDRERRESRVCVQRLATPAGIRVHDGLRGAPLAHRAETPECERADAADGRTDEGGTKILRTRWHDGREGGEEDGHGVLWP